MKHKEKAKQLRATTKQQLSCNDITCCRAKGY